MGHHLLLLTLYHDVQQGGSMQVQRLQLEHNQDSSEQNYCYIYLKTISGQHWAEPKYKQNTRSRQYMNSIGINLRSFIQIGEQTVAETLLCSALTFATSSVSTMEVVTLVRSTPIVWQKLLARKNSLALSFRCTLCSEHNTPYSSSYQHIQQTNRLTIRIGRRNRSNYK